MEINQYGEADHQALGPHVRNSLVKCPFIKSVIFLVSLNKEMIKHFFVIPAVQKTTIPLCKYWLYDTKIFFYVMATKQTDSMTSKP
jgi:hypothetical protein